MMTPSEIIGKAAISFAVDQKQAEKALEAVLDKGYWSNEIDVMTKDGSIITVLVSANLVTGADNNPICMMASFMDITDRKIAEAKLEAANEELEVRVMERTLELLKMNERLIAEVEERKLSAKALIEKEEELRQQTINLQETNTALKIFVKTAGTGQGRS